MVQYINQQIGVSGAGKLNNAVGAVYQTTAQSDITLLVGIAVGVAVDLAQEILQRGEVVGRAPDETADHPGQHAGRNAFAAGVADHDQHTFIVDFDKVVEVAVDLLGAAGVGLNFELLHLRQRLRQHTGLKLTGKFKLLIQPLLAASVGINSEQRLNHHHLRGDEGETFLLFAAERFKQQRIFRDITAGHDHAVKPLVGNHRYRDHTADRAVVGINAEPVVGYGGDDHLALPGGGDFADKFFAKPNLVAFKRGKQRVNVSARHVVEFFSQRIIAVDAGGGQEIVVRLVNANRLRPHQISNVMRHGVHGGRRIVIIPEALGEVGEKPHQFTELALRLSRPPLGRLLFGGHAEHYAENDGENEDRHHRQQCDLQRCHELAPVSLFFARHSVIFLQRLRLGFLLQRRPDALHAGRRGRDRGHIRHFLADCHHTDEAVVRH